MTAAARASADAAPLPDAGADADAGAGAGADAAGVADGAATAAAAAEAAGTASATATATAAATATATATTTVDGAAGFAAAATPAPGRWPMATVLVVDDEPGMCHFVQRALAPRAGQVFTAGGVAAAQALLERHRIDLLVLDITLPDGNGLQLLRDLRAQGQGCEVVLITAFADLDTAIEALRAGAGDLLLKPFRVTQLVSAFQQGMERARLKRENWVLRRTLHQRAPAEDALVGRSIVVRGLQAALRQVAAHDSTVLLSGESGTGKALAAQTLHALSPRAAAPFVSVHCATLAPGAIERELFGEGGAQGRDGLFVYAQGGTLYLDEVAELPPAQQAVLLRALQTRSVRPLHSQHEIAVDVRIVASSSRRLREEVEAGRFRADLYYRLQVVEIHLPPLRAHKEDIAALVAHFVATLAPRLGVAPIEVSADELRYLAEYDWPGNVRELRNLVERSLIVGALNVSALYQVLDRRPAPGAAAVAQGVAAGGPADGAAGARPADPVAEAATAAAAAPLDLHTLEKRHILSVLEAVQGDKTRAAQLLGISRRTLERRAAEWGLG